MITKTVKKYGEKPFEDKYGKAVTICFEDVPLYDCMYMDYLIDKECAKPSRAYLVKLFMNHDANPNIFSEGVKHSPIHWLCYWGDWRATTVLLRLNSLYKVKLEVPRFGKKPTYNSFLEEHGAFNMMQTLDGQTPCDIAGDLLKYKTVNAIL